MKVVIVILLSAISASAQTHFIGATGGVSWTNINSDIFSNDTDSRRGFSGGLSYGVLLNRNLFLSSDIIYSQRGFSEKLRDINGNMSGDLKQNYNYLSIPLKVGLTFGRTIYGFGNIGVIPSLLIDARIITPAVTHDMTSYPSQFDLAALIELGGGYVLNKYLLFTSLTYQQSATTITSSEYFPDRKIRHRGVTWAFGLKYRLTNE
jgi:hypothetical protein